MSLEKGKGEVLVKVKIGLDLPSVGRLIRTRFMAVVIARYRWRKRKTVFEDFSHTHISKE